MTSIRVSYFQPVLSLTVEINRLGFWSTCSNRRVRFLMVVVVCRLIVPDLQRVTVPCHWLFCVSEGVDFRHLFKVQQPSFLKAGKTNRCHRRNTTVVQIGFVLRNLVVHSSQFSAQLHVFNVLTHFLLYFGLRIFHILCLRHLAGLALINIVLQYITGNIVIVLTSAAVAI